MTQVYYTTTDALENTGVFSALLSTLSPARQIKIARAKRDGDKRLLLGAGLLLDRALRPFGLSERDAKIVRGAHGKPYLAGRDDLYFSLSHSGSAVLCAVSDREIGADVQAIRPLRESLLRRACSDAESAALAALPENERQALFFRLWTAKESYLKYLGAGLSLDPQSLTLLQNGGLVPPEEDLSFREYALPGCAACVCARAPDLPPGLTFVMLP